LGVTPSAWTSGYKVLQVSDRGAHFASNTTSYSSAPYLFIGNNGYGNSGAGFAYTISQPVAQYRQVNAEHQWLNAASGTAGNAITFTQAMTLDASGNLGVGTTSPQSKLDVETSASGALGAVISVGNLAATATSNECSFGFKASSAFTSGYYSARISSLMTSTSVNDSAMVFYTYGSGSAAGGTERARIDSSGNLLVGTTNLGIYSYSSATGVNINAVGTIGASSSGTTLFVNRTTSDGTVVGFYRGGNQVGTIGVTTVLTTYNTTSDYRLKTVVGAVTGHGERLDALEPVEYTWNSNGSRTRGFLAHKFQEVYAGSVTGEKDAVDEEGKPVYQAMQASSSEVIADLVAEIQSLRQRLSAANL
jgi:hypothetical protein